MSFASAYFWCKVTQADNSLGIELGYSDPDNKEKIIHVLATAKKQTELNAVAAKLIAWAIFFQAVALILDSF